MGSIDRYIFRTTLGSFAVVLISLTGVIWITQALRGIDLMTSQGQTILTFLGITSLVIPALVLVIAPIALMIAISHTLNKLATDSEIIVMNAAGYSPFRLFRPFLYATCVVALMVAFIGAYLAPDGMRRIKQWDAEITADVLTNILQPGRFAQLDPNLTIRIRDRLPGGVLGGIFVDDRRDPKERVTIIADHGTVLKNESGSYLVLEDGNLERFEAGKRDPALVAFARCLRTHGFPRFPDPDAQGHLSLQMVTAAGIDIHTPALLTAGRACASVTHGQITPAQVARAINGPH